MAADCYTTFDDSCGDTTGVYQAADSGMTPAAAAASSAPPSTLSWLSTLGTAFGVAYTSVNAPPVVAGRGIPGSPASLTAAKTTGISAVLVIGIVAVLVWLGLKRRR
jgi:hypothetical protein